MRRRVTKITGTRKGHSGFVNPPAQLPGGGGGPPAPFSLTDVSPMTFSTAGGTIVFVTGTGIVSPAVTLGGAPVTPIGVTAGGFSFETDIGYTNGGGYALQVTVGGTMIEWPTLLTAADPSAAHPHEPATATRIAESDFSTMPSGTNQIAGSWYSFLTPDTGSPGVGAGPWGAIVADATDPTGEGHVFEGTFPTGLNPGYAPYNIGSSFAAQRTLYLDYYLKIMGTDFEVVPVGCKILGFRGVGGINNSIYPFWRGPEGASNALIADAPIDFTQQGVLSARYYGTGDGQFNNTAGISTGGRVNMLPVGHWLRIIELYELNTIDVGNGTFQMWVGVDGAEPVLVHQHLAVKYQTTAHPGGFIQWRNNPTWGGAGPAPKSRDDHTRLAHLYVSGVAA